MSDIHALSGAYALDALDDLERARFEQHLAGCAECRAEVASFLETTALLAEAHAEASPPALRESVLSGISRVRPLPPQSRTVPDPRLARVGRRRAAALLASAAAVVLLAVGAAVWHPWQREHASVAEQVLQASDAVRVTKRLPTGAGELTLVRSASVGHAVIVGEHVPLPPAGKTYQLWLQQPGGSMTPAGLMPDPTRPTLLTGDATTATTAAVSVEPAGGSLHPSRDVVAVFRLAPASGSP